MGYAHFQYRHQFSAAQQQNDNRNQRHDSEKRIDAEVFVNTGFAFRNKASVFLQHNCQNSQYSCSNDYADHSCQHMVGNYISNLYACQLSDNGVMYQTGVQHTAIGTGFNGSSSHCRMNACRHHNRNKNYTYRSTAACSTGDSNINNKGCQRSAGNEQKAHFFQNLTDSDNQMLVAASVLHAPGKAHAGTNRSNQTGISHALGKSIKRSHRLAGNAAHQNTSGNQYHSGFMSFQQKINYTDNNECTYYQKHLHSLHKIIFLH